MKHDEVVDNGFYILKNEIKTRLVDVKTKYLKNYTELDVITYNVQLRLLVQQTHGLKI